MEKKRMKIAVVGRSATGKSAFIRSFSNSSSLIDSEGEGQTTRCYTEYEFLTDGGAVPEAEAQIVSKEEFGKRRADRALEQMLQEHQISRAKMGIIEWLRQEFLNLDYEDNIKEILLCDKAFFRIEEFTFLDEGITIRAGKVFDSFKQEIIRNREEPEEDREEEANQKEWLADKLCGFYEKIYDLIIAALKGSYQGKPFFSGEGKDMCFHFSVSGETGELLSRFLKVDESGNSLTGILTKVRVVSDLNEKYRECIRKSAPNVESVTLIDTYGLNHSKVADRDVLEKRYDDVLNRDYPDISAVFFVVKLIPDAPSDFKEAILTLYRTRPDVMVYVVGTHIDESLDGGCDEEGKNWLYCGDRTKYRAPRLRGKIWEELENDNKLVVTLQKEGIPKTMAKKRCEIMRRRFAPFCGKPGKQTGNIDYESVNVTSVKALFDSIVLQEHLGEGQISIAKISNGISAPEIQEEFAKRFLEETRRQFSELYIKTAGRTRGKVRENLENYITGYYGTTVNATWGKAFRGAFRQTFSLESGGRMLSDAFGMEGAEKIAFDEIMNRACGETLRPACCSCVGYNDEYDCGQCGREQKEIEGCIWNSFMRAAGYEMFGKRNAYSRVIDWLNEMHAFPDEDGELKKEIAGRIKAILKEWIIPQCRNRNDEINDYGEYRG